MKVEFLDVGQGDSIILHWSSDNSRHTLILDCAKKENQNPVLEWLKENDVGVVDFLVLSHPHHDHYSGFPEVIQHLLDNDIPVKNILHTCHADPSFLKASVPGFSAKTDLEKTFKGWRELRKKFGSKLGYVSSDVYDGLFYKDNNIQFRVLGPSSHEFDKFATQAFYNRSQNMNQNLLSTVVQILLDEHYCLLTSDCTKNVLKRAGRSMIDEKHTLILAQSPHHGSKDNHYSTFWAKRQRKGNTPIVFSVGQNSYQHPDEKVVSDFIKYKYNLHATNKVGGLNIKTSIAKKVSNALEYFSSPVSAVDEKLNGDQVFEYDGKSFTHITT